MTARPRRWLTLALAPLVAITMIVTPAAPAAAAPGGGSTATPDDGDDNPLLNDVLDSTGRRFLAAKAAVEKSTKAQANLAVQVKNAETQRDKLRPQVGAIASQQYRTGGLSTLGFLLNTRTPGGFLEKAVSLEEINALNDGKLRQLTAAINQVATAKARLDQELKAQQQNLQAMKKQKESAEKALNLVGGEQVTGGFVTAESKVAAAAPRNGDNEFAPEGCNVDDQTTGGCVTARTMHMFKEVKKAGFGRFVGCFRPGGPFEHPKGRACDWSLQKSGFSPWHNRDTREYGNNLMAFLVRNADRLGVLYVIWNKMVWFPATGWSSYSGDSDHTDHVHVSML
ncbi:coiled-coil domain-containing protein [Actinoplanes sp. NPDC051859]|uniref:coiled-coil domain-containing protein n=1 Tax=Actinoplanes sp. NPDC051859 TaxID=3363909 RepID=UPI003787F44F